MPIPVCRHEAGEEQEQGGRIEPIRPPPVPRLPSRREVLLEEVAFVVVSEELHGASPKVLPIRGGSHPYRLAALRKPAGNA